MRRAGWTKHCDDTKWIVVHGLLQTLPVHLVVGDACQLGGGALACLVNDRDFTNTILKPPFPRLLGSKHSIFFRPLSMYTWPWTFWPPHLLF